MPEAFRGTALPLDQGGIAEVLDRLSVRAAELWAVLNVETGGCGFLPDRRPVILFERHVFSRETSHAFDASHPDISNPQAGGYGAGGAAQHDRLQRAIALDRRSALRSASWGIGQLMGFNAKIAGYADVEAMVTAMTVSETQQLLGMAGEIIHNQLDRALRGHDWTTFARGYNGPAYAKNSYDTRLAAAYQQNVNAAPPTYPDVKNWAFDVADGYDSRATFNRQAVYGGALTAAAATSALVGLAAFDPGSSAIIGIPIGTTFLSGAMALYNNEQKAVIYGSASQTLRDVLIRSDSRMVMGRTEAVEAVCLRAEVSVVIYKVNNHITLLDPKNVANRLKGVASSIEAKTALAAQRQQIAANAAAALQKAKADNDAAAAALKRVHANDVAAVEKAKADYDTAAAALKTAQTDYDTAAAEAKKAAAEAEKEQTENSVQSLSAEANDFSDLKKLPELKELPPEVQDLCGKPPVGQVAE